MPSPPPRTALVRYAGICLFVVAVAAAGAVSTAGAAGGADRPALATTTEPSATTTPHPCRDGEYSPRVLPSGWTAEFTDSLSTGSLDRWTGGRIAPVGAEGDCSLFVASGERASLSATIADGPRVVVTGVLDLGANGSFQLVDTGGESNADDLAATGTGTSAVTATAATTTTGTAGPSPTAAPLSDTETAGSPTTAAASGGGPTLAIENRGRDFSTEAVVSVGSRSERVSLLSGRFFEFAVKRTADGDVRVGLWGAQRAWDEEWDATFNSVPETEWRVRLDGRAFLDGIAVGVGDRATTVADPPTVGGADTPTPTDEPFPNFPEDPDSEFDGSDAEQPDDSAFGGTVIGLIVIAIGAVMFRYAYAISRFGEQLDAIGSTTPAHEVEPATWNVALTKIGGALVVLFGLYMIVSGFT